MSSASPALLVNPIHLVLGDSGAGCAQAACASWGMPGVVVGFADDLAHGPLGDGEARAAYLRDLPVGEGGTVIESPAPFADWRSVVGRLVDGLSDAVIVWSGNNVADVTFVAMACDRLSGRPEPLLRIRVPAIDKRPYLAMHSPEQIARLYATRRLVSMAEWLSLAQEFARIRDTCGPLRRLVGGRVVGVPADTYDPLLMTACGPDWQPAAHVVGSAMSRCDGPNLMGDAFFGARLGHLIDAGRIEANGPRTALRNYSVRCRDDAITRC